MSRKRPGSKTSPGKAKPPFPPRPLLLLILLCLLVYIWTIRLHLVGYDDTYFILDRAGYNRDLSNLFRAFLTPLFRNFDSIYYRPVFQAAMILEYTLFGTAAAGYHVTSLLLHTAAVLLLYGFFRKLDLERLPAVILASLFAVHPALTQAVAWIPGQNDLLLMVFLLAGILATRRYLDRPAPGPYILQLLFLLLALFTKETAAVMPLVILVLALWIWKFPWRRALPLAAGWIAAIVVWMILRQHAIAGREAPPLVSMIAATPLRFLAIVQYLGKILVPAGLSVFPVMKEVTAGWGLLALGLLTALVTGSRTWNDRLTLFGILWFLVFIFPVLVIPSITNDNLFEHRLYIPLAGILLVLGRSLLLAQRSPDRVRLLLFTPVILLCAVMSLLRLHYFTNERTFWTRAVQDSPRSGIALYRYLTLDQPSTQAEREQVWFRIHAVDPEYPGVDNALGEICLNRQYYGLAEKYLRAEAARYQYPLVNYDLARLSVYRGWPDSVLYYLSAYHRMEPDVHGILPWMAWTSLDLGQYERTDSLLAEMRRTGTEIPSALDSLTRVALRLPAGEPGARTPEARQISIRACNAMGDLFITRQDPAAATCYFQRTLELDPDDTGALFGLARIAVLKRNWPEAARRLRQVLASDPLNSLANNNLADMYFRMGEREKAREVIRFMKLQHLETNPKLLSE